jgi:NAD(P)-dependent dehydrogenase (short-subunit alcohol dehydrogenase family)
MELNGKTCIITGATSGIGKQTAIALAKMGARVIITSRNTEKGLLAKNDIIRISGNNEVEMMECDLASLDSIRNFADNFKKKYEHLHILINNAGTWQTSFNKSTDGIELTFATNVLAPFLLSNLFTELMKKSAPARIINVASHAHKYAKMNFDDLEGKKKFSHYQIYGQSKVALILITSKLSEMLKDSGVTVNSLHPGVVATHLFDNMNGLMQQIFKIFMISPEKGAETSIYLASSPEVSGITGKYFAKKKIAATTTEAADKEKGEKIWEVCSQYVKNYL